MLIYVSLVLLFYLRKDITVSSFYL